MVRIKQPGACIVTGYGINADRELFEAFSRTGAAPEAVHLKDLLENPKVLFKHRILAFPGGFSFGDHLGSGLVMAGLVKRKLKEAVGSFLKEGKPIIGICNGFQVLVKSGMLPDTAGSGEQEVSLVGNDSGKFINIWVRVRFNPDSPCLWTTGLSGLELPIRHGEGKFSAPPEILKKLEEKNLIALWYDGDNPNGSEKAIAGITNPSGLILGLMPHPEAFLFPENHPRWTREPIKEALGLEIFRNCVNYAAKL